MALLPADDPGKATWRLIGASILTVTALVITAVSLVLQISADAARPAPPANAATATSSPSISATVVIVVWGMLPPIYFFLEWIFLRPNDKDEREIMARGQELASKIWLAALALLALFYGVKTGGGG